MKFRKKKKAEEETTTERIECFAFVVRETTRSEHSDVSLNERAHHVPTGFPFRYSFLLHSIGGVRPCEMNAVVVVYVDFFFRPKRALNSAHRQDQNQRAHITTAVCNKPCSQASSRERETHGEDEGERQREN